MRLGLIIPAAGSGERLGAGIPKAFVETGGKTLLERSILPFLEIPELFSIAVAVPTERHVQTLEILKRIAPSLKHVVVTGGMRRQDSVQNAVNGSLEADFFAIHDAARPFINAGDIQRCYDKAKTSGAAILAVKSPDTIKWQQPDSTIERTLDRNRIWMAQTPQIFARNIYERALAQSDTGSFTDDASMVEGLGLPVSLVEGNRSNIKITWPEDLRKLEQTAMKKFRIGNGYDIHRLVSGRKLILGGVELDFELGLDGHSDADVILHALMDAMLGALSLGDIGKHFPNTDMKWKGADSRKLLRHVNSLIEERGYRVGNADVMVIAEKPKLNPRIPEMIQNIASDLGVTSDCVSIKATTAEKIGPIGNLEGIEAHASVLLEWKE